MEEETGGEKTYRVTHEGRYADLTLEEILAAATEKKVDGNSCFKRAAFTGQNEDYRWAARRYTEGIRLLNEMQGVTTTDRWARSTSSTVEHAKNAVECAEGNDDDTDVIDLGEDGVFDAVAHDQSANTRGSHTEAAAASCPPANGKAFSPRVQELRVTLLLLSLIHI